MKSQNLSIVFVDIVGFTPRTSAQTREENQAMLQRFENAVKPAVRAYGGKVVKNIGDAYMLTFQSPTDALLCSAAIHDRLALSNTEVASEEHFGMRAAVNVGEVRIDKGDVFGEPVNIAARIEGKTGDGEIYFSEAVYLAMTRTEVPSEELGYFELKGIPEKVRLYRVLKGSGAQASNYDNLPFSGLGIGPIQDKLDGSALPAQAIAHMERPMSAATGLARRIPGWIDRALQFVALALGRWQVEIKRSRRWRIGSIIGILAIVAVLSLAAWSMRPKPKPLTTWQKIQRGFGN